MADRYEPPSQQSTSDQRVVVRDTVENVVLARRRQQQVELKQFVRRLSLLLSAVAVVVIAGSFAFALSEHTSAAYGFLWTLDIVTTLGSLPTPDDTGSRIILACLEILGIGTLFYGLATVAEFFVSGQLSAILDRRRMEKMIDSYSDHYIVCGYGRVGRQVVHDLQQHTAQIVVVDHNPMHREAAKSDGVIYVEGHASDDDVLTQAGIERAHAVIACVDSDAENIFVALSARELSSTVQIIARASAEDAERKLMRAGANEVISPYKMTGTEMARLALTPTAAT
jgi:voltage-gated potassium channel